MIQGHELLNLVEGLRENNLVDYEYLVTGYIGSESFLSSVLDVLETIQDANPGVKYVCDPVLGDEGKCYVPSELINIFRTRVIPKAYMITPNQFEMELLTESKITDEQSAIAAMVTLFHLGPTVVVLSSAEFPDVHPGKLFCYSLMRDKECPEKYLVSRVIVDKLEGKYTGTGDCTTALMLAWMHKTGQDPSTSLLHSISSVQGILTKTRQRMLRCGIELTGAATNLTPEDEKAKREKSHLMHRSELCIVPGKRYIESPPVQELKLSVDKWLIDHNDTATYKYHD